MSSPGTRKSSKFSWIAKITGRSCQIGDYWTVFRLHSDLVQITVQSEDCISSALLWSNRHGEHPQICGLAFIFCVWFASRHCISALVRPRQVCLALFPGDPKEVSLVELQALEDHISKPSTLLLPHLIHLQRSCLKILWKVSSQFNVLQGRRVCGQEVLCANTGGAATHMASYTRSFRPHTLVA